MVTSICDNLKYPGSYEDVMQEMSYRLCTESIVQDFNRFYSKGKFHGVKMSTYMFGIIRNHILSNMRGEECKILKNRYLDLTTEDGEEYNSSYDMAIAKDEVSFSYKMLSARNQDSDDTDSLKAKMKDFAKSLRKVVDGEVLIDIFMGLYEGYSSKQIAEKLGLTEMSVCHKKKKIALFLRLYFIEP
jgi:DNA-directed RNA polymerase specialized sigma subunit